MGNYNWTRLQSGLLNFTTNARFTGFNLRVIKLDSVENIAQSILSTGWNPLSEIVGLLFQEDQLAFVEQLKQKSDKDNFQVQLQKLMEGMFQYWGLLQKLRTAQVGLQWLC